MKSHTQPASWLFVSLSLLALLSSCSRDVWRTPPLPTRVPTGGPAFSEKLWGKVGSVLVSDVPVDTDEASQLWVGFNSDDEWQQLHGGELGRTSWMGGQVKLSPEGQYGFYFDPDSTQTVQQPSPERQTTITRLREEPRNFTSGKWYIHGRVLRRLGPARHWH